MKSGFLSRSLAAALIGLAHVPVTSGATVGITPADVSVEPSAEFELVIMALDIGAGESLAGGMIDLGFDPGVVQIDGVEVGPRWDFAPVGGALAEPGTWSGIGFDVFANEPVSASDGDSVIASIQLTALRVGEATVAILDSSEFFSSTIKLDPSFTDATVRVASEVPLPPAVLLLGSAVGVLLALPRLGRRRARQWRVPSGGIYY